VKQQFPGIISSSKRICILVLGMHRSGTSAVTRVMNLLGANLATGLMPTLPNNLRGFWESTELMGIHDDLLACVSSSWDDWRPFSMAAESKECRERIQARLSEWIDREFKDSTLFVVKDPRICRFVPLWIESLQSKSCEPRVVIPVRHPSEVAESLFARDGMPHAKAYLLWLRHLLDAERATREIPRAWVHYDDLLNDWPAVTKHIAQHLGLSWPMLPEDAAGKISAFLSTDLRHHVASHQDLLLQSDVVGWVRRTYAAVTSLIADGPVEDCLRELDQVRTEFDTACLAFGDLIEPGREFAAVQTPKDARLVTRSEHDPDGVRLENLRTGPDEHQLAISRIEGEIGSFATGIGQMRQHVATHETIAEALHEETKRLGEVTRSLSDSLSKQGQSITDQITRLRGDLNVIKAGIEEMRLMWKDTRSQPERAQADAERVQAGKNLRKRIPTASPPEERNELLDSGLFDPLWYLDRYPDVAAAGVDPLKHWLTFGMLEGRDPNPEFDTDWYFAQNPDVSKQGQNALEHYLRNGSKPGINPNPRFDGAGYLKRFPEVAKAGLNPLVHHLRHRMFLPLVTVVVPNFNHAPFLRRRLDSIYNQTYKNFRVILLDDCSRDASREILDDYRDRYPQITICDYNEQNSGGVFRQWRKAIELAAGSPLLWIAESDDYCDEDFLEKLVPFFRDESVMLSYCSVKFVDENGRPHSFTYRQHLSPHIDTSKWSHDYLEASHREVETALAIKNTIPNVSGAVMRTPSADSGLLGDESWLSMKICGDWVLYLHLIAAGKVAYCARTTNYFRIHSANSSHKVHQDAAYYREHARVSEEAARLYRVSDRTLQLAREVTRDYYDQRVGGGDEFDRLFEVDRIAQAKAERHPTVMISLFSFIVGGGEIIPIRLANELKRQGCPVVVHCFDYIPDEPGVRAMLRSDIPVVRAHTSEQILKMLAYLEPDVINTHHKSIQSRLRELARAHPQAFASIRHVATMHGMFEMPEDSSDENPDTTLPEFLETVDRWIYTADKNLKPFQVRGLLEQSSFTKLPNGMEAPKVRSIPRSELGIDPGAFVLCEASRAVSQKGWYEAIEAVTKARQHCTRPIHLVLLGTGLVFDELSQQSLPPYIHLLGFADDCCSYYAMSDMAILPSTFSGESFPMTLVEAILVGKPAIATDLGEIRSMLTSESGVAGAVLPLVDGKVPVDQLSEQIVCFAEDAAAYEQACAASRALAKRFDIREIAGQYLDIFAKTKKRHLKRSQVDANGSSVPSPVVQMQQLREMMLFDATFYREQYPGTAELQDPLAHYVLHGCSEQRMPNEWFDLQYIRQSGRTIDQKGANPLWYYGKFVKDTQQLKTRSDMYHWGYCPVCEQRRLFLAHFDTNDSFNYLRCIGCNGAPRDRAVAVLLDQHLPGWRKTARVHESSPCTPCLKMLAGDYSASHYYSDKGLGAMSNGFRNENIEKLTFQDNEFDVIAALEVIEHVFNPSDMVREMIRCTKPGGIAVFTTVPCGIPVSRPRARIDPKTGDVEHFFPPVYHGNPIGDGALLTWDFGLDFDDYIRSWSGGADLIHWCEANAEIGIIPGGIPHVYVLKKPVA
jgi:glycosyltransferase involved in cell wall biosynthesis/SAM-dependent methyltransferase